MSNSPTEYQEMVYDQFVDRIGSFAFPCCDSGVTSTPITNEGEDNTQVYCPYCSQYIFLEDYNHED